MSLQYKKSIQIIIFSMFYVVLEIIEARILGAKASFLYFFLYYGLTLSLLLSNALLIFPQIERFRHSTLWILLCFLVELAVYFVGVVFLNSLLLHHGSIQLKEQLTLRFIVSITYLGLNFLFISSGYWFVYKYNLEQQRKKELEIHSLKLEKERAEHENALLRQQINYHFVGNTLTYLYERLQMASPPDAAAIFLLSRIVAYSSGKAKTEGLSGIREEVRNMEDYLKLLSIIREVDYPGKIKIEIGKDLPAVCIPSFILVTLMENIIHYGDLDSLSIMPKICVSITRHLLVISAENAVKQLYPHSGHGIGLENIHKRLDYHFPDAHTMNVDKTKDYFSITITINL